MLTSKRDGSDAASLCTSPEVVACGASGGEPVDSLCIAVALDAVMGREDQLCLMMNRKL